MIRMLGLLLGLLMLAFTFANAGYLAAAWSNPRLLFAPVFGIVLIAYGIGGKRLLSRWAPRLTESVEIRKSLSSPALRGTVSLRRMLIRASLGLTVVLVSLALVVITIDPIGYLLLGGLKGNLGDSDGAIAAYSRAIDLYPNIPDSYDELAWQLATAERSGARDGKRALESALKACELTGWKNPMYLETLAAAYARLGNFDDAVKWQREALQSAKMARNQDAVRRLELYGQGKAWPPD
jgi:tetratricopeptide (TPR) repeat protein